MQKSITKPISALENYNKLLKDIDQNNSVILTKNGQSKYAIIDIKNYEQISNGLDLLGLLNESANEDGYRDIAEVFNTLR